MVNYLITEALDVTSVQHLFMKVMDAAFLKMHRSFLSGLLFTVLISIMWWFGIHGNNVLNQVAEDMFTEIIPGEIVSKSFMDTFVIMTAGEALEVYRKRDSVEKIFRMLKTGLEYDTFRVHNKPSLESKTYVLFIASIVRNYLYQGLREVARKEKNKKTTRFRQQ